MLSLHGILTGHTLPTREDNCLDHFMLRIDKTKFSAFIAILNTTTTDHFTTFLTLSKQNKNIAQNKTKITIDYDGALMHLENKSLAELLYSDDPIEIIERLLTILNNALTDNSYIKSIPNSKRILKPWVTQGMLRCIKNRNALQKKFRADKQNELLKTTYTRYRNFCNNLLKKLKRKYDRDLLSKSIKNSKLLWQNIKNITFSNKSHSQNIELINIKATPTDSAEFVNNFFVNIGKQLAEEIQCNSNGSASGLDRIPNQLNSFALLETVDSEVNSTLMSLKSDSSPGWDNIPTRFLKVAARIVVPIITHLTNLCIRKGTFPAALKRSIVTPVYKSGERDNVSNYRPISILPALSKVLEKILNGRLLEYLNKYNILSPFQFGFRQGRSTEDAVVALSSLVTENLDCGNHCLAVFLDLKKAFDTVSVPILIHKMEKIGIRGTPLSLFTSYLSNRKQRVKLDRLTSGDVDVTYGVPQGSVLGPTLFLIYINELCNMKMKNAKVFSYADDTAIIFTGKTWDEVKASAELGLSQVAAWLNSNLLTLNTEKTNYICFSIDKRKQPLGGFNIKIHTCGDSAQKATCDCSEIRKVTQTKYLGVLIDERLCWYPHLEQVIGRVRKLTWIFRTLRHVVPRKPTNINQKNLLNEIYASLVQSVLVYCIPIWGGAAKTRYLGLERAQRALLKVMYFKKRRFPTSELYRFSNVLSVRKLYVLNTVLKKHKDLPYDSKIIKSRRKYSIVQIPVTKTKFAAVQYTSRSAYLYNKLNKVIYFYDKHLRASKKLIINFLNNVSYEETELLLQYSIT
jgi:hypothetical protein